MSRIVSLTVNVRLSWWVKYYLQGVVLTAWLTGCEPDIGRVSGWIARGSRITVRRLKGPKIRTDLVR